MGRRYRTFVTLLLVCMSFGPIVCFPLGHVLPEMIDTTSYLSGGSRATISKEEVLADPIGVLLDAKRWQRLKDTVITRVENHYFPCHDDLMLLHAKLQRASIAQAAHMMGYDAFPSFYGSHSVYSPKLQCIAPVLASSSDVDTRTLTETLDAYTKVIRRHPDITWVFYPVDSATSSEANPTARLVSEPETYDYYYQITSDGLPGLVAVLYDPYRSSDEFYRTRFTTDHHWNIDGAIEGFGQISQALGMEETRLGKRVVASCDEFFGSYARQSLCMDCTDNGIEDVAFDISELHVTIDGKDVEASILDYASKGIYKKKYAVDNLYRACFHDDYGLIEIVNDAVGEGTLLIIGDSYSNPIERLFTGAYHKVISYDPRWCDQSLEDVIISYTPDAVVSIQEAKGFFDENRLTGILHGHLPQS